jgi:hypothetical protein
MPLDYDLLAQARTAEARVIDAEQAADIARAEFHGAVRRLQLAGASLREIAEALGLSHQRVHQIVEAAGGSRRWRKRVSTGRLQSCSFCGRDQNKVKALIAGPGVFICDRCIGSVHKVLTVTGKEISTPIATIQQVSEEARAERCSFCGKRRHQVPAMASAASARICDECLQLCVEMRRERLN